jgi:hypothetical protein
MLKVSSRVLALTSVQEVPGVVVGWVVIIPQAAAELAALIGRPAACKTVSDSTIAPAAPSLRVRLVPLRTDRCRPVRPAQNSAIEESLGLPCLLMSIFGLAVR